MYVIILLAAGLIIGYLVSLRFTVYASLIAMSFLGAVAFVWMYGHHYQWYQILGGIIAVAVGVQLGYLLGVFRYADGRLKSANYRLTFTR